MIKHMQKFSRNIAHIKWQMAVIQSFKVEPF